MIHRPHAGACHPPIPIPPHTSHLHVLARESVLVCSVHALRYEKPVFYRILICSIHVRFWQSVLPHASMGFSAPVFTTVAVLRPVGGKLPAPAEMSDTSISLQLEICPPWMWSRSVPLNKHPMLPQLVYSSDLPSSFTLSLSLPHIVSPLQTSTAWQL